MAAPVEITDAHTGKGAKIIDGGALAVLPPEYNQVFTGNLTVADTVLNLVPPAPDQHFVGNVLVLTGSKTISTVTDAIVSIYAATAADEALTAENIEVLTLNIARSASLVIPTMNIITINKGAYINCVSSDVDVSVTLFGYYTGEGA